MLVLSGGGYELGEPRLYACQLHTYIYLVTGSQSSVSRFPFEFTLMASADWLREKNAHFP
jgi:hypothetical protein